MKLFSPLLISCKNATMLMEKKEAYPLSTSDKFRLFIHKRICKACQNYEKQSEVIDHALKNIFLGEKKHNDNILSSSELEQLKNTIKGNLPK